MLIDTVLRYAKGVVVILAFAVGVLVNQMGVPVPLWLTGTIASLAAILVPNKPR